MLSSMKMVPTATTKSTFKAVCETSISASKSAKFWVSMLAAPVITRRRRWRSPCGVREAVGDEYLTSNRCKSGVNGDDRAGDGRVEVDYALMAALPTGAIYT